MVAWGHLPYGLTRKLKPSWVNPVERLKAVKLMAQDARDSEDFLERIMFVAGWSTRRRWRVALLALVAFVVISTVSYAFGFPQTVALFLAVTYLLATCGLVGLPGAWLLGILAFLTLAINSILLYSDVYGEVHVHNAAGLYTNTFSAAIILSQFVVVMIVSTAVGAVGMLLMRTHQEVVARRHTEARYRLLVEETSDVAYISDLNGHFTYVSPSATKLTGYKREQLVGMHYLELVVPEWQEATLAFYKEQFHSGLPETIFLFPIICADGDRRWVEQTVVLETDGDKVSGFHALVRDVTDRKRVEDELQSARDKAVRASRFKSQLLANVSHDLRIPLSSIMLIAEMLQKGYYGDVSEEQEERLQIIRDSGAMLQLLIKNLLDEAQLEAGKLELKMQPFPPEYFLNITSVLKPLVEQRGLRWEEDLADNLPSVLYGDVDRLKQILSNLVTNAAKFTRKGKVKLRVFQPDNAHWTFEVSDTGKGIAQNVLSHVFEPFWQEDGSITRGEQTGIGLGLSIVKQLTTCMDGSITVDSIEGEGTTFTATFPIPDAYRQQKTEEQVAEPFVEADAEITQTSKPTLPIPDEADAELLEEGGREPLNQSTDGVPSEAEESTAAKSSAEVSSEDADEEPTQPPTSDDEKSQNA